MIINDKLIIDNKLIFQQTEKLKKVKRIAKISLEMNKSELCILSYIRIDHGVAVMQAVGSWHKNRPINVE